MFNHRSRTSKAYALIIAVLAILLLAIPAALVVERSYRSARALAGPIEVSPLLRHPEQTGIPNLERVSFESRQGVRLAGWYMPSRNRAAIIVTHGTNADRSSMLPELRLLADAGFGVLAFDWPGLGESGGAILWDAGARDALTAAIDWMMTRSDVDSAKIGGLGFSIGAFVMTQVAAGDPRLRALVLEGTPTSFAAYIKLHYGRRGFLSEWPARWAIRHTGLLDAAWMPKHLIGALAPRPILLIGGTRDTEIPAAMAEELYAAAHEPKALWLVPGAQHGGYALADPVEYRQRLLNFFTTNLAPIAAPASGAATPAPAIPGQ